MNTLKNIEEAGARVKTKFDEVFSEMAKLEKWLEDELEALDRMSEKINAFRQDLDRVGQR